MSTSVLPQTSMKVSIEAVSSVKKSLRVEVPEDVVTHAMNDALAKLQSEVQIQGFRQGKAPVSLLRKKYEDTLRERVLRTLVPEYSNRAIQESGLSPVDLPHIHDIYFRSEAPLSFTVHVDIAPEIHLENYVGLTLPKQEVTVTESDIQTRLEKLQEQLAYFEGYPEDHLITTSDHVRLDLMGTVAGKPLKDGQRKDYWTQIGSQRLHAYIEEAILGKKKGDRVVMDVPLPADYPETKFAGKTACFTIDVQEVTLRRLPDQDDEFAKDLGAASFLELKEKVKTLVTAEKEAAAKRHQKEILVKQLIALHPIEVPQSMVERAMERISHNVKMDISDEKGHSILRNIAESYVQEGLILEAIAAYEKIEADASDVENAIQQIAQVEGVSYEKKKRELMQNQNALRGLKERICHDKTLEHLYSLAQFEAV